MKRPRRDAMEHLTKTVNRALGEQGCSYCRLFKPAEQVRKIRAKVTGRIKYICDSCREGRTTKKEPPK